MQESRTPQEQLRIAAEQAGFTMLPTEWRGWNQRYAFLCAHGHHVMRFASGVIRYSLACLTCADEIRLQRLQQIAQKKGGRCLEQTYLGSGIPHRFACAHGHEWSTRPSKLRAGSWCHQCAHVEHSQRMRRQDGLPLLQNIAKEKGGQCLSDAYKGMNERHLFRCAQGHQWEVEGAEIARGAWCRRCSNEGKRLNYRLKDGLERLQQAALAKGGVCLATAYIGSKARYRFRCKEGHEWETTGNRLWRGAWCVECTRANARLGIELMRKLAHEKGGTCLSEHYQNSSTKLQWECHRGHRWHAIPASIIKGHWCAQCGHLDRINKPGSNARWRYLAVQA
jgi:hypothetical protein